MHKNVSKQPTTVAQRFYQVGAETDSRVGFTARPQYSKDTGHASPTGTTGNVNLMVADGETFEYHIKGTQTIVAPVFTEDGLDIALDQTSGDGAEFTQGITARSKGARVVGEKAFNVETTLYLNSVAGTKTLRFGFRTAEGYEADFANYDEFAVFNVDAGAVKTAVQASGTSPVVTSTGETVADKETFTLRVEVGTDRVVKFLLNGIDVTQDEFKLADGIVVIPVLYFTQATAGQTGAFYWKNYRNELAV